MCSAKFWDNTICTMLITAFTNFQITAVSACCQNSACLNDWKSVDRLKESQRTSKILSELHAVAEIEHVRWNAYMRTEGFVYKLVDKEFSKSCRDYKAHYQIIPVSDKLEYDDLLKDI